MGTRMRHAPVLCRRSGLSIVYVVVMLVGLMAFVSLAVDVGRIRLARTELQVSADAAARAGARSLPVSTDYVLDNSSNTAYANTVIGARQGNGERVNAGVVLDDEEDIEFGTWDAQERTFTPIIDLGGTQTDERRRANAVHVIGRRTQARDNPIPLIFCPVVGIFSHDITRNATAHISFVPGGGINFGFIGIDWVRSNGNGATIRNDSGELYGGGVASDGDISLGNGDVYGDARPGIDQDLNQQPNSVVTGWAADLDFQLEPLFPPVTAVPPGASALPPPVNKVYTLVGSNDPLNPKNFTGTFVSNTKTINVTGYCRVYVNANLDLEGASIVNPSQDPRRLEFYVIGNRTVDLGGSSQQWCHVYAPESDVRVHGTPGFHGWIVGETLTFIGTSNLYYDGTNRVDLPDQYDLKIRLVQ